MSGRRTALILSATAVALLIIEAGLRLWAPQSLTGNWMTTSASGYAVNRRSTSATHAMPGRSVRYHLNALGFRGAELPSQGRRVLVVGDSVTFGVLLDESDTIVARLAASSTSEWGAGRLAFVNAGVGGWGTADYAAFLEDRGDELRPDAVVVFIGFEDVSRAWRSPLWALEPDGTVSRRSRPSAGLASPEWPIYPATVS